MCYVFVYYISGLFGVWESLAVMFETLYRLLSHLLLRFVTLKIDDQTP